MNYGWRKDLPDSKDLKLTISKSVSLPSEIELKEFTPISNQLSLGSCVANSTCDALEILQGYKDPDNVKQLSRLFVYFNSRKYHNEEKVDKGTYIRYAFASLKKLGVCLESTWDYDVNKVFSQPNLKAYKEGDDNTITGYYSITSSGKDRVNDICVALSKNHPVVFGTVIGNDFANNNRYIYDVPTKTIGGHAMIVVGYRKTSSGVEFKIRNSWGSSWGDHGYTWMTESYIKSNLSSDFWVPTLVPNLLF